MRVVCEKREKAKVRFRGGPTVNAHHTTASLEITPLKVTTLLKLYQIMSRTVVTYFTEVSK